MLQHKAAVAAAAAAAAAEAAAAAWQAQSGGGSAPTLPGLPTGIDAGIIRASQRVGEDAAARTRPGFWLLRKAAPPRSRIPTHMLMATLWRQSSESNTRDRSTDPLHTAALHSWSGFTLGDLAQIPDSGEPGKASRVGPSSRVPGHLLAWLDGFGGDTRSLVACCPQCDSTQPSHTVTCVHMCNHNKIYTCQCFAPTVPVRKPVLRCVVELGPFGDNQEILYRCAV